MSSIVILTQLHKSMFQYIVKDKRAAGQLKCAHGALPASVTIFNDFDVSTFIDVSLLVTVARPL